MKMDKSEKKKSKTSPDDEEAMMKAEYERMKARAEGGGGGGGSNIWDNLLVGKNMRRVLPRPGTRIYYVITRQHFKIGPDGNKKTVRCIAGREHFDDKGRPIAGTPCPCCRMYVKLVAQVNAEHPRGSDAGKTAWREVKDKWCPRTRYLMNVLNPDGEIKLLGCGEQIMLQLANYFNEEDSDVGDFTSLEDGRWMNIKRTGKGKGDRMTKYEVRPTSETEDISDQADAITEGLHDLERAAGTLLTADQIRDIMKGVSVEAAEEEYAEDDGE